MGRIVVTEFVSLDGVMEDPGGSEDFEHGGWTFEIDQGPEGGQFKYEETFGSEALLLGRVTYEGFADAWPERDGDFADRFNSMPKYVVSATLKDPEWTNSHVLERRPRRGGHQAAGRDRRRRRRPRERPARAGPARDRPRRRAAADGVPGRARERQAPLRRGLEERLKLAESRTVGDGVLILTYRRP